MKKTLIALFLAFVMIFSCFGFNAFMAPEEDYELNCKNAIVLNTDTGRVVFEKGADEKVPIASLTKIMTAMVIIENCNDLDEMVEVKLNALLTIGNTGLETFHPELKSGEKMSVRDLLYSMLISSAADAAVVLADYIGGSIDSFVGMMNEKAQELGMNDTHFVNTHGLDAEGHYSTARDVAVLADYAMKNETFADIVSRNEYTTQATDINSPRTVYSTNHLLKPLSSYYYQYADGMKTGFTGDAGRCLVATALKNKVRFICVVLGCDNEIAPGELIAAKHFKDARYLLEKAFGEYSYKNMVKKGGSAASVPVKCLGIDTQAQGVYEKSIKYLTKKGEKPEVKVTLDSEKLKSLVKAGDKLGVCEVTLGDKTLGTVNIVAKEDVNRDTTKVVLTILIWILCGLIGLALIFVILITVSNKKGKKKRRSSNLRAKGDTRRKKRGLNKRAVIVIAAGVLALIISLVLAKSGVLPTSMKGSKTDTTESVQSSDESEKTTASETAATEEPGSVNENETTSESETETTSEAGKKIMWSTTLLNVRTGPGTSYEKVGEIPENGKVTVIGEENGWSKIEYEGLEKYVSSEYLTSTEPGSTEATSEESTDTTSGAAPLSGTTSKGYKIETKDGVTYVDGVLIANKSYSIPKNYGSGLTSETSAAFNKMKAAAAKDGVTLTIISGYRSYETQERLYNNYVARDGKAEADTYSARPGTSEHQTGLAMDLNSLATAFGETKEGKWLAAHCAEYGFIIRYPKGKQNITGYVYEPWHVRYLGVETAKKIYESGLTVEEYYGITSKYQ